MFVNSPYFLLLSISTCVLAVIAIYLFRIRRMPGATQLAIFMVSVFIFSFAYMGELLSSTLALKLFHIKIEYIGIVSIPVAWLAFICSYTNFRCEILSSKKAWVLLSIFPAITIILVWTNELHSLIWSEIYITITHGYQVFTSEYGPWFWLHSAYSYFLLLAGTLILIFSIRKHEPWFQKQKILTIVAVLVPWFINGLYLSGYTIGPNLDPTPFAFLISGMIFTINLSFFQFFKTIPIAKSTIIDGLQEGIFVLDQNNVVIDVNPAAEKMLRTPKQEIIGKPARDFSSHHEKLEALFDKQQGEVEFQVVEGNSTEHLHARLKELRDNKNNKIGRLVVVQNITSNKLNEQKLLEAQRKDFLMKELNHRTKNNLIMVSSLIRMKAAAIGDGIDLSDLEHQVDAIRIVHEKLCHTQSISHIHMKDYLQDLLNTLFSISHVHVHIENKVDSIKMKTKKALLIGLIINEIATNAVKHGFYRDNSNIFSIELNPTGSNSHYVLRISHNGEPLPEDIDFHSPRTLGLRLISALVQEIDGTIELKRRPSPEFTILFPCQPEA